MEQRPLRLGDIVDDYCPRERRVTNHAIVAIIGDAIRQTRCTTCDTEHVYKHGKEPRRRKSATAALYDRVLADAGGQLVPPRPDEDEATGAVAAVDDVAPERAAAPAAASEPDTGEGEADRQPDHDVWPGHRQLIRAQLPRIEGELPPPRPIPEFTMYQRQQRPRGGYGFRQAGGWQGGNGNGHPNGNVNGNVDGNSRGGRPGAQHRRSGRHRGKHKPPR
jgi:hypothetical protein